MIIPVYTMLIGIHKAYLFDTQLYNAHAMISTGEIWAEENALSVRTDCNSLELVRI